MDKPYFCYWGKARRASDVSKHPHHLLPWHCLDVAACGYALIMQNRFAGADLFAALGVPDRAQAATFFAWLLCWHDAGKFSRAFQQQYHAEGLVAPHPAVRYGGRHDALGLWLWEEHLSYQLQTLLHSDRGQEALYRLLNRWMLLTFGHHGRPVSNTGCASAFLPEDKEAALLFLQEMSALFPRITLPVEWGDKAWRKRFSALSWQLSALVVLADWTGSNTHYFPYCSEAMPLGAYWQRAREQADRAISGLPVPAEIAPFVSIQHLFPFIAAPTPLQQKALQQDIAPAGPQLFILEDVTGAGKTEAALILAHRLVAAGKAQGLYIGLPTTATANAMYQRMRRAWLYLYQPGSRPSLMLSHGSSHLSAAFSRSVWHPLAEVQGEVMDADQQGCAAWFADQRKKSLLADVGVGTLDQALMAIMPIRHQNLRLLGLHNKLLICDEVHAYDSYMSTLLEKLIEAQACSGQSVILLSATLSARQREKLIQAFQRGAGFPSQLPPPLLPADYPWFTQITQQGFAGSGRVGTRKAVQRTVNIAWQHDENACLEKIAQVVETGGCIGWIRNSVEDAMRIYGKLGHIVPEEDRLLLHSRFAFCDRLAIENKALSWFGKQQPGELPARRGKVLISTQIVESSIDIDLDYMISDLAPVDLLIQRAGRLQRHMRDANGALSDREGRQPPILLVFAPPWSSDPAPDWLSSAMRNTSYVYRDHAVLWLTQQILRQQGEIKMPEAARLLIDAVYGDEVTVPAGLMPQADSEAGKALCERNAAAQSVIDFSAGYSLAASDLWDEETTTRLGDKTVTLCLAYRREGKIVPYGEGEYPWDMSQIKVRENWWKENSEAYTLLCEAELEVWKKENHRWNAQVIILPDDLSGCKYSPSEGLMGKGNK